MTEIIILLTALIFYFIGKYAKTEREKEIIKKIIKGKTMSIEPIRQKTPEERRKEGTPEEAVENIMREEFKKML